MSEVASADSSAGNDLQQLMNQMLESLGKLGQTVESLRQDQASLRAELREDQASLRAELRGDQASLRAELRGNQASLRAELRGDQASLRAILNEFRGETTERILRKEISVLKGCRYSSSFCIRGLSGLARLVLPPKRESAGYSPRKLVDCEINDPSDLQFSSDLVRKLTDFLYEPQSKKLIETALSDCLPTTDLVPFIFQAPESLHISKKNKLRQLPDLPKVQKLFANFLLQDKKGRERALQSDSGIGMLFFSAASGITPVHELELDCRGSIEMLADNVFHISVGEIKSSRKSASDAARQLEFKLSVLERAIMCCYDEQVKVIKSGKIFLPVGEPRSPNPPSVGGMSVELIYI